MLKVQNKSTKRIRVIQIIVFLIQIFSDKPAVRMGRSDFSAV